MDDGEPPPMTFAEMYPISGIIIAAIGVLSVVVFFMYLLYWYVSSVIRRRQRRRRRRRIAARALPLRVVLARSNRTESPKTGLDPSVIATIPMFMFMDRGVGDGTELECSVCLSVFEEGDKARVLPNCEHSFHSGCIDKWLSSNITCPICRAGALPRLRLESREPPVRLGPFEKITFIGANSGGSASMLCLEGTSGKAATGGSSTRFGSIPGMLSWENCTEHNIENQ